MKFTVASTIAVLVCSLLSLPTSQAGFADGFKKAIPSDAELKNLTSLAHHNQPRGLQGGFEQSAMIVSSGDTQSPRMHIICDVWLNAFCGNV
jgi:hypothetical protein